MCINNLQAFKYKLQINSGLANETAHERTGKQNAVINCFDCMFAGS